MSIGEKSHKEMSSEVKELRVMHSLSKQEMADILRISLGEYILLENGHDSYGERDYFEHTCNAKAYLYSTREGEKI